MCRMPVSAWSQIVNLERDTLTARGRGLESSIIPPGSAPLWGSMDWRETWYQREATMYFSGESQYIISTLHLQPPAKLGPAQRKAGEHEGCPLASLFSPYVVACALSLRKPTWNRRVEAIVEVWYTGPQMKHPLWHCEEIFRAKRVKTRLSIV